MELFGEGPSRVVVSVSPERWDELASLTARHELPLRRLGETGGDRLRIRLVGEGATGAAEERGAGVADELDEPLSVLRDAWERGLPRALGEDAWLARPSAPAPEVPSAATPDLPAARVSASGSR